MSCENDDTHNTDNYCSSCSTCHDCFEEGEKSNKEQLQELKQEFQKAINERNAAWFQLEKSNITIAEVPECECDNLGSECSACEIDN